MNITSAPSHPVDVLIIGAGPVGLAAALWFVQKDYQVVIVEQYSEVAASGKRSFNARHQQVGLDPTSLAFLEKINPDVRKEINKYGCPHDDWINISIFRLQNILYDQLKQHSNVMTLFDSRVASVITPESTQNANVIVSQGKSSLFVLCPELVVICDGHHDGSGTAKRFFNFSPASRVTLSSSGIIGMIQRPDHPGTTCLANFNSDCHPTSIGPMHVRLLGSLQERYIALGAADEVTRNTLDKLTPSEIVELLKTAYLELKDSHEPEFTGFTEVSKSPIHIVLDYRKETIKLLEGSNTFVSVEGDAARKTTFFSGSGLNSGYKGLDRLLNFCHQHSHLVFQNTNLLYVDEILLEKDRESLEISLELLKKGIKFILTPQQYRNCTNQ